MARPTRLNADYFSHDSGMRNHRKIKALRKKFPEGYGVFCMLLEVLTAADNFNIIIDEIELEILAGDFDIEVEKLVEIIDFLVKIKLISKDNDVIHSCGLNDRLQVVLDKRNLSKQRFLSQKPKQTNVSVTETTQSKVKESKVKESKDNYIHNYQIRADDDVVQNEDFSKEISELKVSEKKEKISAEKEKVSIDFESFPEEEFSVAFQALQAQGVFNIIKMQHERDVIKLEGYFRIFYGQLYFENKLKDYPTKDKFFKHFFYWIPKYKNSTRDTLNQQANGVDDINAGKLTNRNAEISARRAELEQLDNLANSVLFSAQA